jgi:hypothetical protein
MPVSVVSPMSLTPGEMSTQGDERRPLDSGQLLWRSLLTNVDHQPDRVTDSGQNDRFQVTRVRDQSRDSRATRCPGLAPSRSAPGDPCATLSGSCRYWSPTQASTACRPQHWHRRIHRHKSDAGGDCRCFTVAPGCAGRPGRVGSCRVREPPGATRCGHARSTTPDTACHPPTSRRAHRSAGSR